MKVFDTPLYPWSTRELPNIRCIADFKWYVKFCLRAKVQKS